MTTTPKPDTSKSKCGPPKGSTNAARHYMRGGKLPKALAYVENRCNALRRNLESAVLAVKGEIGITDTATINTVMKHERHGALALHYLRIAADTLTPSEILRFSAEAAKASDNRDKCIRLLNLDRDTTHDAITALYAMPQLAAPQPNGDTTDDSE